MFLRLPAWGRAATVLGIDLHAGRMRLVGCVGSRRAWRVQHCSACDLPSDVLRGGRLQHFDALVAALREQVRPLGFRPQLALAAPEAVTRRQALSVPDGLRPWRWRTWLQTEVERLGQATADTLVFDVCPLPWPPLTVLLTVCPREVVEDWQGVAQAAGLELVRLDDRPQAQHRALVLLGLVPTSAGSVVLAESGGDGWRLQRWQAGRGWQLQQLGQQGPVVGPWLGEGDTACRWLIADATSPLAWREELRAHSDAVWPSPDLAHRVRWQHGPPPQPDGYLAALGLAWPPGAP